MSAEAKLKELGLELPPAPAPAANYVPYRREGNLLIIAGQVPFNYEGKLDFIGKVGRDLDQDAGYQAARLCALNGLAQIRAALGSLDKVRQVLRVGGWVHCTDDFTNQPEVINGASDLLVQVFGDKGRHARAAVGTNSLPRGVATEVEFTVAVE